MARAQPARSATSRSRTARKGLDLGDAAVLILRAERHEHGAQQRQRDADQKRRIVEDADQGVADVLDIVDLAPRPHHPPTLTARLAR